MQDHQKDRSNTDSRRPVLMAVAAAAVLLLAGLVAARYMTRQSQSGILYAQEFYFTSNFLAEDGKDYSIDPQAGTFEIQLYNFADSKRVTAEDIKYKVSVSSGGSADKTEGTLTKGSKRTETVTVTPDAGEEEITVTVKSEAPYEKTLTATFHLQAGNSYTVENKAGDMAAVLTLICTDFTPGRKVTLKLPEGVVPDAADDNVSASGGNYIYTFPDNGIYAVVLLKSAPEMAGDITAQTIFSEEIDLRGILK